MAGAVTASSPVATASTNPDGLTDAFEKLAGTEPELADTDADGLTDGSEIRHGLDPLTIETDPSMFGGQILAFITAATAVPVTAPVIDAAPTIDPHRTAQRFVDAALDQRGDAYQLGAEADLNNADPGAFDRSAPSGGP
jgi:hypothetical protein